MRAPVLTIDGPAPAALAVPRTAAIPSAPPIRRLRMPDGVEIAAHEVPAARAAFAQVVLLHGTGMNARVYVSFARLLAARGVQVVLLEQRGHGASGGEPGHVAHPMQYADDLCTCLVALAARAPSLPLFLLAHSGGCAIALKALPRLDTPLAGLALLAPTLAHDPLMARRRASAGRRWSRWREGVAARPPREVPDHGQAAMRFHLATFAAARLLRLGRRRPALVCQSVTAGEPAFIYTSDAVVASMIGSTQSGLAHVSCPLLLATGEQDVFVNDASVHHALAWMLAPAVPLCAYSYPGADHFTVLFHAARDLCEWLQAGASGAVAA